MNTEYIDIGKDRNETEMRLLQKIEFGKEIIPFEFFKENKIPETDVEVLSVYQLDPNIRFTIIYNHLLKISTENSVYNYIDKGRKVLHNNTFSYREEDKEEKIYFFNDLDICERNLKLFDDFDNKRELKLKKIGLLNESHCYLVFKEDIDIVKEKIKAQREEERLEKEKERAEELAEKQKQNELQEKLKTITKDTKLEDGNIIIYSNYLIDKKQNIKIEFKKPIVELFNKNDVISDYADNPENFIQLSYDDIIGELCNLFETGKYEEPIETKFENFIKTDKKCLLDFKIYSHNPETKEEKFITNFKIDTTKGKKGKIHYRINSAQIPKQKIKFLLRFLRGRNRRYWEENNHNLIERYQELEKNIENFKYYSGTQLELLQGKEFTIYYKERQIPLFFDIKNPDRTRDNWQVIFGNLILNKTYTEVKKAYNGSKGYNSKHIAGQISNICDSLKTRELEDEIIKHLNIILEKIKQAEIKAKTLFMDFIEKNKTKIIPKDNFYLIKGKLKTYKIYVKNNEVKAETYPNGNYICINEAEKEGHQLVIWDKLLQFTMALLNDSKIREEISTLQ